MRESGHASGASTENANVNVHILDCGLTLLVEEMASVRSVAYELLIPGGIALDHPGKIGASHILAELTSRGVEGLSARELSDSFDLYGIRHSESASMRRFGYRGLCLGEHFSKGLELLSRLVLSPTLPEEHVSAVQALYLQDILGLRDQPSRWASVELDKVYFPEPYNRSSLGEEEDIRSVTRSDLLNLWREQFSPIGSILSVAGHVNFSEVVQWAEKLFSKWSGKETALPAFGQVTTAQRLHIPYESAQEQVVLRCKGPQFGDEHYYAAKLVSQILSGGMFGRLFSEVREKRGLCYSVSLRHSASDEYGSYFVYAGTTPERVAETLHVIEQELERLAGSITGDEFHRAKANLKALLVMGEESSSSRASSNASDWWMLKRVRSLLEIHDAIDQVDIAACDACLRAYPFHDPLVLTLGVKDLRDEGNSR